MNREFRFRYYDNKMVYLEPNNLENQPNLMQYTGLSTGLGYDKGNLLFEGDIIKVFHGEAKGKIGVIKYSVDNGGFIVEGQPHRHQYYVLLDCDVAYKATLLGNVFENPNITLSTGCWIK